MKTAFMRACEGIEGNPGFAACTALVCANPESPSTPSHAITNAVFGDGDVREG